MTAYTLLLNSTYEPFDIISPRKALDLIMRDRVVVLEEYDGGASYGFCLKIPAVMVLKRFVKYRPKVKFNRKSIYIRDEFQCQYCGKFARQLKDKVAGLNFDHVVPRCQGGVSEWTNVVTSCIPCNTRKAGRTPEQAGMKLLRQPVQPKTLGMVHLALSRTPSTPKEWMNWLYWESELERE